MRAARKISATEIVGYPLIGIDPTDPYGRILAGLFSRKKLDYDITIRARFGTTVCALVKAGLGIAVIDEFTVADGGFPGVEMLRIAEPTRFDTYVAVKRGAVLSPHMEHFIHCLRTEMRSLGREREKPRRQQPRKRKKDPRGIAAQRGNCTAHHRRIRRAQDLAHPSSQGGQ